VLRCDSNTPHRSPSIPASPQLGAPFLAGWPPSCHSEPRKRAFRPLRARGIHTRSGVRLGGRRPLKRILRSSAFGRRLRMTTNGHLLPKAVVLALRPSTHDIPRLRLWP